MFNPRVLARKTVNTFVIHDLGVRTAIVQQSMALAKPDARVMDEHALGGTDEIRPICHGSQTVKNTEDLSAGGGNDEADRNARVARI